MTIATYSELQTAVNAIFSRTPPAHVYTLATREINARLKLREMTATTTLTVTASTPEVALPAGFLMARGAYLDTTPRQPLDMVTNFSRADGYSESGVPKEFTVEGDNLVLNPSPDGGYDLVLTYVGGLSEFSDGEDTNDILVRYPDLYVYGALKQAAVWAQDAELITTYATEFERALRDARKDDRLARHPGPLRVRADRVA